MSDLHHFINDTHVRTSRLRRDARNYELEALYAKLMAYCLLIRDHLERIDSAHLTLEWELADSLAAKLKAANLSACAHASSGNDGDDIDVGVVQDLLNFLVTWEANVNAQYPDNYSWDAEDYAPQEKTHDPHFAVWKAAQAVFNVLSSRRDCTCDPAQNYGPGARLRLGTYRNPSPDDGDENEGEVSFDMFLSTTQDWQEVRIRSARERAIQFAVSDAKPTTARRLRRGQKIQCLCGPIFQMKNRTAYRLQLQVNQGQLLKLQPERSDQLIDRSKTPVSLDRFLQGGPRSLTEKTKRILMVLLSHSVLHLHNTTWMHSTWNSSNIIFFRSKGSETPLRPFLDTNLSRNVPPGRNTAADPYEYYNNDVDPDDMIHPCPTIVALAVMLMEVFFVAPFNELARRFNVAITEETAGLFRYLDADMVFQACKSEIPENSQFLNVIDKCLNPTIWTNEDGATLDCQALRTVVYEEVVRPLENDLRQAYRSISIPDLDQLAQTLDMSSWDRTIRNQQSDEKLSVELCVGLNRALSPFCNQNQQPGGSHISKVAIRAPNETNCIDSKFFDDEAVSGNQSGEYDDWKAKYLAVYEKFITPFVERASNRVKVAVLDTGIDLNHPEIQSCDENIRGKCNFLADGSRGTGDSEGHGTFVAALLLGYAPHADIYVGKVAAGKKLPSPDSIAKAIRHAVDVWKVDMISMSFGYPTSNIPGYAELEAALKHADFRGVLLFAAASNNGGRLDRAFPAREKNVICVHSTDVNGNRSRFSPNPVKYRLNLATVGESIESAWPEHLCNGDAVAIKSGTSFATPIMVGVAALLLMYIRLHIPDREEAVNQRSMENLLRKVAQKGPDGEERDGYWFVDLSLFNDSLFGKEKGFIDSTIRDILNS